MDKIFAIERQGRRVESQAYPTALALQNLFRLNLDTRFLPPIKAWMEEVNKGPSIYPESFTAHLLHTDTPKYPVQLLQHLHSHRMVPCNLIELFRYFTVYREALSEVLEKSYLFALGHRIRLGSVYYVPYVYQFLSAPCLHFQPVDAPCPASSAVLCVEATLDRVKGRPLF